MFNFLIIRFLFLYSIKITIYLMAAYMFANTMCIGWDMEGTYYDDTKDMELYSDLKNIEEVY